MQTNTIPVIDIDELRSPGTLAKLDTACREWGFFQVINHGIPQGVIDTMLAEAHSFFAQSTGFKRRILRTPENPWGFYDRELTKNVRDLKEIYDFGPADGVIKPQWPRGMPGFRNAVNTYYAHCERLAHRLLSGVSMNLGLSPGCLSRRFGQDHTSFLRLNYYPVDAGASSGTTVDQLGVGQHTDSGVLTLLLQDEQPGLEVFRNNAWHLVEPRKDGLVINIGDMVQVWSNDEYFAALHRVIASRERPRFSIPFFLSPPYRMNYAPLPTMVSEDRPARYREINWGEFRARRAEGDYADYGEEVQIEQYRISA